MMNTSKTAPTLIQRLKKHKHPRTNRSGIDQAFGMDYMGSAEFEFGTLPKNLKWMRADAQPLVIKQIKNPVPQGAAYNLWYVGGKQEFPLAEQVVSTEFADKNYAFKERLYLKERLFPQNYRCESNIDGWWALSPGHKEEPEFIPFAIFLKKDDAKDWKSALSNL